MKNLIILAGSVILFSAAASAPLPMQRIVDRFSEDVEEDGRPAGWEILRFKKGKRPTTYTLEREGDEHFLMSHSSSAASSLVRPIVLRVQDYPWLTWRWRTDALIPESDPLRKKTDDVVARVYVAFRYDPKKAGAFKRMKFSLAKKIHGRYPPDKALNYIWARELPIGTMRRSAYSRHVSFIVVESGSSNLGQWVYAERDVYGDFKAAFGKDPPPVEYVAVMTDTDNTRSQASASFDDFIFWREAPSQ